MGGQHFTAGGFDNGDRLPGSPKSEGRTVLVTIIRFISSCKPMPWVTDKGILAISCNDLFDFIGFASPTITLLDPIQVRYQVFLSAVNTMSSLT